MTPPPLPRSPPKAQSRCGGRGTEAVYRYIDTGGAVAYVLVSRLWLLRDLAFRIRDHVQYSIKPCSIELNSFGTPTSPSSLAPRAPPTPRPVRAPNLTSVTIVVVTNRLATRTTHVCMPARLAGAGSGRLTSSRAPSAPRHTPCRRRRRSTAAVHTAIVVATVVVATARRLVARLPHTSTTVTLHTATPVVDLLLLVKMPRGPTSTRFPPPTHNREPYDTLLYCPTSCSYRSVCGTDAACRLQF